MILLFQKDLYQVLKLRGQMLFVRIAQFNSLLLQVEGHLFGMIQVMTLTQDQFQLEHLILLQKH